MGERMGELINLTITMVIKVDIGLTHKENFMDYVVYAMPNSFSEDTGSGYEYIGNKIQRNRPIYNIKNYTPSGGIYYNVTWNSYDGDKHSGTYSHIGRLNITNIDDHHPNHS